MKNLIVIGFVAALTTGCSSAVKIGDTTASAGIEKNKGDDFSVIKVHQQKCDICTEEKAYYSRAVAQPSPCNDYPVEHRVQIPEVDDRSRSVDRYIVTSDVTPLFSTVGFGCSSR